MDLLDPLSCQLHHIAFDRLKSHTPLPCPGTQSINIPLKFHCVFFILNFTIANTVSAKSLISDSISDEMSFMYIYAMKTFIRKNMTLDGSNYVVSANKASSLTL